MRRNDKERLTAGSLTRRGFVAGSGMLLLDAARGQGQTASSSQTEPSSAGPAAPGILQDLVAANRILADQGVLDGYGHVSVRHNANPNRYLLSRSLAPELVAKEDILEFDLDSNPVDAKVRALYVERFIHGQIYRSRPDVHAIVHSHSPALIPFGATSEPLQPIYHMAAFVGEGVPVFDIRTGFGMTDMLVRDPERARALARALANKPAVLMRGHGAVVVASTLPIVVGRSVYLQMNAVLQAQAMTLGHGSVFYLSSEEAQKATPPDNYQRAWELWKRKAIVSEK